MKEKGLGHLSSRYDKHHMNSFQVAVQVLKDLTLVRVICLWYSLNHKTLSSHTGKTVYAS